MEIYLDNAANNKTKEEVIEAICDVMKKYYSNPSYSHNLCM